MKKLVLVVFLFVGYANAQTVQFGAKAGVNFATIGGDGTEEVKSLTGLHVGLVSEIFLGENFSLQPEVLYSTQGAMNEDTETLDGVTYSYKNELKLDYINVPIMVKYYITPGLNLQVGPQVGYLINAEMETTFAAGGEKESGTEDVKDYYKDLDFAMAAGLEYKLDMGLFFNARYNLGLSNLYDSEIDGDESIHNNVFQLSVGFMF